MTPTAAEIRAVLAKAAERVKFYPASHRYRLDGEWRGGVTTIAKQFHREILQNWLIEQQARGTALACLGSPIAEGEAPEAYADRMMALAAKQHEGNRIADEAANIGSQAHSLIEWYCRRRIAQPTTRPVVGDQAEALFDQWLVWAQAESFEVVAVEQYVFGEPAPEQPWKAYVGTLDLLAFVQGRLTVLDWKTKASGGKLYPDQRLQSVAYRYAVWEMLTTGGLDIKELPAGLILVLPRDGGKPQPIPVASDPVKDFQAFEALLRLYSWSKA